MTSKRGPAAGTDEAKRGSQAVKAREGADFYARIGKQGGETMQQRRGGTSHRRGHLGVWSPPRKSRTRPSIVRAGVSRG